MINWSIQSPINSPFLFCLMLTNDIVQTYMYTIYKRECMHKYLYFYIYIDIVTHS